MKARQRLQRRVISPVGKRIFRHIGVPAGRNPDKIAVSLQIVPDARRRIMRNQSADDFL
ncbi:MAG: hypothetical protein IJ302_00810 [Clostridia bacterium]|nr:hypothetical protein [Clostridia bacterium]